MSEHIRALVVILALALPTFWLLRPLAPTLGMVDENFTRRRNLWLAITVVAFLSHNFWIYVCLTALLLVMRTKGKTPDPMPAALALFVAFTVPPFSSEIPFIGGIRYLFTLNHLKLIILVCLVPVVLALWDDKDSPPIGRMAPDYFVLGYCVLLFLLQLPIDSFTNALRAAFERTLEVLVPYYVLSRSIRKPDQLRSALGAFATAALLLAPVAIFEASRFWLLYGALPSSMNIFWAMGSYLGRGGTESLRAAGSTGHAIALGYTLCVGLFAWLALQTSDSGQRTRRLIVLALFLGGIFMSKSRGPWVGAVAGLLVYSLLSAHAMRDLFRLTAGAVLVGGVLMLTPYADKVVALLPFVGSVDADTVDYRKALLTIGWQVVLQRPLFGAPGFMAQLESLRQGQGIIDIVNSYLGIALSSGLVGLGLFAGSFAVVLVAAYARLSRNDAAAQQGRQLLRSIVAAIVCILVTIFTTSSITVIPFVFWSMLGLLTGALHVYRPARTRVSLDHNHDADWGRHTSAT